MNGQKEFKLQFEENNFYFHYTLEEPKSFAPYYKHCHNEYELYVFLSGDVDFIVENVSYKMTPSTILLIPPHKYHYAKMSCLNTPYHRFTFLFAPSILPKNLKNILNSEVKIFPLNSDSETIARHFSDISRAIKNFSKNDANLFLSLFLCDILLDLKYCDTTLQPITNDTNSVLCSILTFINEHIYEPLNIEYIAQSLFLTPVYISQIFSKSMHISLMKYIKQKKLLIANDLIRNGSKSTNVAILLGFSNYSTFFRLYKKEFGHTPSEDSQISTK